ncbi:hypothetical protein M427DRAFT_52173 [Gonapodya prolifera JEL478]|uniref:RING-type E3 ubiquitin transferase n=1 Tax=Gonapodya prolifera (strain JEL478) TaxID=1344416 RepID=A0A139AV29_GONPJ|nr:hypothetical protein M427DRAFT_52173 [Gonapodya prolifera JEL478]|eukprot:KXS20578.1 hypothetical protein M427DRAFT_52173 [Gonapodya prolifera JEL478]
MSALFPPYAAAPSYGSFTENPAFVMVVVITSAAVLTIAATLIFVAYRRWRRRQMLAPLRAQNPEMYEAALRSAATDVAEQQLAEAGVHYVPKTDPLVLQTLPVWKFERRKRGSAHAHHRTAPVSPESPSHTSAAEAAEKADVEPKRRVAKSISDLHRHSIDLTITSDASTSPSSPSSPSFPHPRPRRSTTLSRLPPSTGTGAVAARSIRRASTGTSIPTISSEYCPICLDAFSPGSQLRRLPCEHTFHIRCVDEWLVNQRGECPLCRLDLTRRGSWWQAQHGAGAGSGAGSRSHRNRNSLFGTGSAHGSASASASASANDAANPRRSFLGISRAIRRLSDATLFSRSASPGGASSRRAPSPGGVSRRAASPSGGSSRRAPSPGGVSSRRAASPGGVSSQRAASPAHSMAGSAGASAGVAGQSH